MALLRWQQTITDDQGNVVSGAEVEIRDEGSGSLVALFSDRDGLTQIGNPINADANGYAFAYLESTRFKVTATDGADSFVWRDVRLPESGVEIIADHVAEDDPHAQYAQLSGGADADFSSMPLVGGDPIVESGSNSDGEWTRWADGTQLCRGSVSGIDIDIAYGSLYRSNVQTLLYPLAFVDSNVQAAAAVNSAIMWAGCIAGNPLDIDVAGFYFTTTTSRVLEYIAFGDYK